MYLIFLRTSLHSTLKPAQLAIDITSLFSCEQQIPFTQFGASFQLVVLRWNLQLRGCFSVNTVCIKTKSIKEIRSRPVIFKVVVAIFYTFFILHKRTVNQRSSGERGCDVSLPKTISPFMNKISDFPYPTTRQKIWYTMCDLPLNQYHVSDLPAL